MTRTICCLSVLLNVLFSAIPGLAAPQTHWSFRSVQRPPVPRVKQPTWVQSPIDAFILDRLERSGLTPAPPADRVTLIRRATFDLTGLPPTPEEIGAFLSDRSAGAFARVVDRLLASPAYGEKWGRHWLDLARYADSNGLDENIAHGNAWRYRDYVVHSLNMDKPFDRFIREQIAGDLLPADPASDRYERLIATGFLSLGPKVLAEVDEQKMEMDIIDEQIDTLGRSILGITLGCARCHDHKFDPISSDDYYALAGIFKSTRTMEHFKKIARWWEHSMASEEDLARQKAHQTQVDNLKQQIAQRVESEKKQLLARGGTIPADNKQLEGILTAEAQEALKQMREQLASLEKAAPELPGAMGVGEGSTITNMPRLVRGDHLQPAAIVPRRFPVAMTSGVQPEIPQQQSGRLQLAEWIVAPENSLTSRVLANRLWRWHFGKGLVRTPDNFGLLGEAPTHPELLDWLASEVVAGGWSLKNMHRTIMLSSTYQMSSQAIQRAADEDPENIYYARTSLRRLEAEEIRDALLAVSGGLDRSMGGSLLQVKNREFFFDHTSKDQTRYDSPRRSIYLPIVRNHLYEVFQLFDSTDAAVAEGNRTSSTVAPQALFFLNSDLMKDAATRLANRLLDQPTGDEARIAMVYRLVYGRSPVDQETRRSLALLTRYSAISAKTDLANRRRLAWAWLCHTIMAANEFVFVR